MVESSLAEGIIYIIDARFGYDSLFHARTMFNAAQRKPELTRGLPRCGFTMAYYVTSQLPSHTTRWVVAILSKALKSLSANFQSARNTNSLPRREILDKVLAFSIASWHSNLQISKLTSLYRAFFIAAVNFRKHIDYLVHCQK